MASRSLVAENIAKRPAAKTSLSAILCFRPRPPRKNKKERRKQQQLNAWPKQEKFYLSTDENATSSSFLKACPVGKTRQRPHAMLAMHTIKSQWFTVLKHKQQAVPWDLNIWNIWEIRPQKFWENFRKGAMQYFCMLLQNAKGGYFKSTLYSEQSSSFLDFKAAENQYCYRHPFQKISLLYKILMRNRMLKICHS